jgi:hypothetical protein
MLTRDFDEETRFLGSPNETPANMKMGMGHWDCLIAIVVHHINFKGLKER